MKRCWRQIGWLLPALLVVSSAMAGDIGRLFTTPADRAELDNLRSNLDQPKRVYDAGAEIDENHDQVLSQPPLLLNGLIQRSDGRTTVWLNGQRLKQQGAAEIATLRSRADRKGQIKLRLNEEQRNVIMKPGQVWDPASQRVIEQYRIERSEPSSRDQERKKNAPMIEGP